MTTLREIATLAKVSTTTVSKVMNGDFSKVSQATRERIERIAREKHYYPNRMAKGLAQRRSNMIGLLLPRVSNPIYAEMARGIINLCEGAGYATMLFNTDEREDREQSYISTLAGYRADGAMIVGSERSMAGNVTLFDRFAMPYVAVDSRAPTAEYRVTVDDFQGVRRMTEHLLQSGHRRIAFISGQGYVSDENNPRLAGYREALTAAGVAIDPLLIEIGSYDAQSGYDKTLELLSRRLHITAIVCGNDLIAVGAYRALRQAGLQVPLDMSIVGYDDIFVSDILDPPLTTVKSPVYDMGVAAAGMLLKRIRGQLDTPQTLTLEPTLVLRNSVSVPRREAGA